MMQTVFNRMSAPIKNELASPTSTVRPLTSSPSIWTRKISEATQPRTDQSFPKPLGAMLTGRNLVKLEKNEAAHMSYLRTQLKNHKLDDLDVGEEIGRGGMKTAYDLPGTGTVLVTIPPGGWGLAEEIKNINRLKTAGMPTAKILTVGNYCGSEAMVMEKFVDVVKPSPPNTQSGRAFVNSKLANQSTLDSLTKIRKTIAKEGIIVFDLQFGVRGAGALAVLDPLQVIAVGDGLDNKVQIETLDQLIIAINKKLNAAKLAA